MLDNGKQKLISPFPLYLSLALASKQDFQHNCDLFLKAPSAEERLEAGHSEQLKQHCNCMCFMGAYVRACSIVHQHSMPCVSTNAVLTCRNNQDFNV